MPTRHTLALLCVLALPVACSTGPYNGTTTSATVVGKSFLFQGYFNEPNALIKLQVMTNPANDPDVNGNWVQFATATTETDETHVNSTDPLYYWSVNAAPVPVASARWTQGGVVRVRAVHIDANNEQRILTTFDDVTFSDCLTEQFAIDADWVTIGMKCAGVGGGNAVLVSTTDVPAAAGDPSTLGGFLGRKGEVTPVVTEAYYFITNAPLTLSAFKTKYLFGSNQVTATYYNDGDLGLGREMHCNQFFNGIGIGLACYVSNYTGVLDANGNPVAKFGFNQTAAINDAVARQHKFATVAMVYDPPAGNANSVKFIVYNASGQRVDTAQLDNTANNISVPNNCLACHGINSSFSSGTLQVTGNAKFLPFDPFSFKYSTDPGFTFDDQASEFRRLNAMVSLANPSPAISEFIAGMYAPKAVTDSTAVANNDFVPGDWANANGSLAGTALYKGVVKVGCRTCHISATTADLDFADAGDFSAHISSIRNDVCGSEHIMPHAERVMKKFWQSGARAYLVTAYGPPKSGTSCVSDGNCTNGEKCVSGKCTGYPSALQACKP